MKEEETCLGSLFVSPGNNLLIGFRGICGKNDPGHPQLDNLAIRNLRRIFFSSFKGKDNKEAAIVICPQSDHSGHIHTVDSGNPKTCLVRGGNRLGSTLCPPGDGVIISGKNTEHPVNIAVSRTRDCVPLVGSTTDGNIFSLHLSNANLFGYPKPSQGFRFKPILKTFFGLVNPKQCQIFIGPSIGGLRSNCECYCYTETVEQKDGSKLIDRIYATHPSIRGINGFDQIFLSQNDKMIIQWGQLIVTLLLYYGVPNHMIDKENNYCTMCNPNWYSRRRERKDNNVHKGSNLTWIARTQN